MTYEPFDAWVGAFPCQLLEVALASGLKFAVLKISQIGKIKRRFMMLPKRLIVFRKAYRRIALKVS